MVTCVARACLHVPLLNEEKAGNQAKACKDTCLLFGFVSAYRCVHSRRHLLLDFLDGTNNHHDNNDTNDHQDNDYWHDNGHSLFKKQTDIEQNTRQI